MGDNEYTNYFANFAFTVESGLECGGNDCRVWFLSEVDTWHECACNAHRPVPVPHPEAEMNEVEADTARFASMEEERDNRFVLDRDDNIPF